MKVIENELQTRSVGWDNTTTLSVNNQHLSKIFKLLSTSTYKQTYESVLRELCCNAVDSNVEANKPTHPIYLTYKDNTISIKDDGVGMSEEFINTRYMSVGDSTKEGKENMIGNFGIGRLSLFAYTTHYNLISRYDGIKQEYLVSLNDEELPELLLLSSEKTDECNGVEVSFELLHTSDFYNFQTAAQDQLKYFRNIIIEGFGISNDYTLIQGKSFLYRPDRSNTTGKLEIAFHNVCYPIDFNFLGISPININCAIYFPQETAFQPEAARENLRNTENNKKLILTKIEEFKKEIKEIYKKQEIVEDFFEWKNSSDGIIELEGHRLNVYDVINSPRMWAPSLNTNLNKDFKSSLYRFENVLMSYRQNKKYYNNGWWQTGSNKKIFYALSNISNQKLAKTGWNGLWTKRTISPEMYISQYDLERVYDKSFYSIDAVTKEATWSIDYHSEFQYLADEIFKCVQKHSIDVHTIPIPKNISNKNSYGKEEIRAKIGQYWGKYSLSYFDKYRHVVYTTNEEEYNVWKNLSLNKRDRKNKQQDKIFIIFLTTSPHLKKLPDSFITPEEFLKSDIIKNTYIKYKKSEYSILPNINTYAYENIHNMYKRRINELKKDDSWRNNGWGNTNFPRNIESELEKMYDTSHWKKLYDKRCKELMKYKYEDNYGNDKNCLKYKLLYKYIKKRYEYKSKANREQSHSHK